MSDIRFALRRLLKSPVFTIAAVLTLAIAIGATASVFAVVDGVLLKPFPYRDADRVLTIWESNPAMQMPRAPVAPLDYIDFRNQSHAFTGLAALADQQVTVTGGQQPERVLGAVVTPSYFEVAGISPVIGRGLAIDSAGPAEVVIGYGLWQRRYGGARGVLGHSITLDDQRYTVVGVMPAGLPGPEEVFTRLSFGAADQDRGNKAVAVLGRLKPTMSADAAERDLQAIARHLGEAYPATNAGWSARTVPLVGYWVGDVRTALVMLFAAALCVLLIGAANLANLFLVRCLGREREIAIRTALGATRQRVVREFLTEAGIVGAVAGVLGVALAIAGVRTLRALAPTDIPRISQIAVDGRVIAFCAVVAIGAVMLFGLAPAWRVSRGKLADLLKQGGRGTGSARNRRAQDGLVVLQVAVALVLLTGAGLLLESFARFQRVDVGFRPEGVLSSEILLDPTRYPTAERQSAFVSRAVEQMGALPGIVAAGAASNVPAGDGHDILGFAVVGDPVPDAAHVQLGVVVAASPSYFHTMGIAIHRGRGILPSDDPRGTKVAVIDDRVANLFFRDRDPIGHRIAFVGTADTMQIVGVVGAVKEAGLLEPDFPEVYRSFAQSPNRAPAIVVRAAGDPAAQAAAVRRVLATLDPAMPVFDVGTMTAKLTGSIGTTRFATFLATLFAGVAVILGALGIYSVLAYIVAQRQREIGVRLALGATRGRVVRDVVRHALALTGVAIVLGSSAAWVLTRVLASLFVGVSPHDPLIFIGAAVAFGIVALVAASIPAIRTARVNPVVALTST
jgi:putative ABC transport system permease protein